MKDKIEQSANQQPDYPELERDSRLRLILENPLEYDRQMSEQMRALESKSKLSRWLILRKNVELRDYIEYREAQQSVRDAQESAYKNEGRDIVLF
jgi:hypothetical protein